MPLRSCASSESMGTEHEDKLAGTQTSPERQHPLRRGGGEGCDRAVSPTVRCAAKSHPATAHHIGMVALKARGSSPRHHFPLPQPHCQTPRPCSEDSEARSACRCLSPTSTPRHPENALGLCSQGQPLVSSAAQTRMQMSNQLCCLSIGRRWKCAAKISGSRKIHPCESRSHSTIGVVHSAFLKAFTSKHMETKTPLDTHVSSCARKCGASQARLPSRFVSLHKFNPSLSF